MFIEKRRATGKSMRKKAQSEGETSRFKVLRRQAKLTMEVKKIIIIIYMPPQLNVQFDFTKKHDKAHTYTT